MNAHRYLAVAASVLVMIAALLGYLVLTHAAAFPGCAAMHCSDQRFAFGLAKPLYRGTWPLALLFLGMAFVGRAVFYAWLRFFGVIVLLPFCLVLAAEPVQTGFFPGPFPDRTGMALAMSVLLVVSSIGYLCARTIRSK